MNDIKTKKDENRPWRPQDVASRLGLWMLLGSLVSIAIHSLVDTYSERLARPYQIVDTDEVSYLVIEGKSGGYELVTIPPGSIREERTLDPDAWLIDVWVKRPTKLLTWCHCERTTRLDFAGEEHDIFKITTYHTLI